MATDKQKAVFTQKLQNPTMSYAKAMRNAGYDEKTSESPNKNLIQHKGWQELITEYRQLLEGQGIDQARIAKKLNNLLDATDKNGDPELDIQVKALNIAREDLGLIREKKEEHINNTQINIYNNMSDEELEARMKDLIASLT